MWVLIVGVVLLVIELLTGSFYILWYGIGLVASGAVGWAIGSEEWIWQSAAGLVIGHILLVLLRKRLIVSRRSDERRDEFLLEEGEGVIKDANLVEFRGTIWRYEGEGEFAAGERVIVRPDSGGNRVNVRKK
ncbi:hypothetical protein FACS189487_10010 [Campylobacterota bacterium]|nr:hypothetical protein FACS189487_10010 [Campylobacterota bacterium]